MLFKTNTNGHKHPNSSLSIIEQDTIGETNKTNKWHSTQEPRTPKNSPIDSDGVLRCQWSKAAMRPVADYCRQPLMTLFFGMSNSLLAVVRQKCIRCLSRRIIQAGQSLGESWSWISFKWWWWWWCWWWWQWWWCWWLWRRWWSFGMDNDFIPHFMMGVITSPWWDWRWFMFVKWCPWWRRSCDNYYYCIWICNCIPHLIKLCDNYYMQICSMSNHLIYHKHRLILYIG